MKIDTAQIDLGPLKEKPFPSTRQFRICISPEAHDTVWEHASRSVASAREKGGEIPEVGGILLGDVYKDSDGPFLEVFVAIEGRHTKNQGTQMTFTPETWEHVNRIKDEQYPEARVVGWYHTHPRFGIFLSDMDRFIHKSHFPQPWTTALVVDPVQDTEGFFVWTGGEPRPVSEYWIGSARRMQSSSAAAETDAPAEVGNTPGDHASGAVSRATFALVIAMVFLVLLFVSGFFYMRESGHTETEADVRRTLDRQKLDLQIAAQALLALREQIEAAGKKNDQSQQETRQRLQQIGAELRKATLAAGVLEKKIAEQQEQINRLQGPLANSKPGEASREAKKP